MEEKTISRMERITNQLELIDKINKRIEASKKIGRKLMVRQYEHLKKQYIKNLFEMLAEDFQITFPKLKAA